MQCWIRCKQGHTRLLFVFGEPHSLSPRRSWLSYIRPVWPSCLKTQDMLAVVSLPHLPPRRIRNHQVLTKDVTGATTATKGVGMENMAANDEMTVGVAVIATYAMTEVVAQVATAAIGVVTMTVEMRVLRTVAQGDPGLSEMTALLSGLHPHHLGLPLGAQVLDTTTTGDEILPHHHHGPRMTAPGGQACHLRMALLGVSKKTCTEGTVGLTEEVTSLNGKCATCVACQKPHRFPGVGNSVPIALSVSGHRHHVHPLGDCADSLLFSILLLLTCSL